jgi:hypothetical protein
VKAEDAYESQLKVAEAKYQQEVQYTLNDAWENGTLTRESINAYAKPDHRGFRGVSPATERFYLNAVEVKENEARAKMEQAQADTEMRNMWTMLKEGDSEQISSFIDDKVESGEWTISQALTFQNYGERMADKPQSLVGVARELKRKGVSIEDNAKAFDILMNQIAKGEATKETVVTAEPTLTGNQIKLANLALSGEMDVEELRAKGVKETTEWAIATTGDIDGAREYAKEKRESGEWTWEKGERFVKKTKSYALGDMNKVQKELYRLGVSAEENENVYEGFMDKVDDGKATEADYIEAYGSLTSKQRKLAKLSFKEMESEQFRQHKADWAFGELHLKKFLDLATDDEDKGGGGLNSFEAIDYKDQYRSLLENDSMTRKDYLQAGKEIVQKVIAEHPDTMSLLEHPTLGRAYENMGGTPDPSVWKQILDAYDKAIEKSLAPDFDPTVPVVDGGQSLDDIFGGMGE